MTYPTRPAAVVASGLVVAAVVPTAHAQQWRDDANARIEQHRKGDLSVRVVDAQGNAVGGVAVDLQMQNHAFGFGTAVTASHITGSDADDAIYREKVLENFNHVVFENDLKWPAWDGQWGPNFNETQTFQALDWLDANRLPARGHYLSWATWGSYDAHGGDADITTLKPRLFDHITAKAGTIGNRVYEWDVINHPVGWKNDTYVNRTEDAGLYANGLDFYADIIEHSRASVPEGTKLWINEDNILAGGLSDEYETVIQHLKDAGQAPDGVGFQGHFIEEWNRIKSPETLYANMERFAALVPSLRVTEFDIDVGDDDARQAELLRDYLTVMFSHADMEAVTMWGFWEGRHWREDAALYQDDWTEKAALLAYQDLVFDQWWTDERLDLGADGEAGLRAFLGDYTATVTIDGVTYAHDFSLDGGGISLQIQVPEPGVASLLLLGVPAALRRRRRTGRARVR